MDNNTILQQSNEQEQDLTNTTTIVANYTSKNTYNTQTEQYHEILHFLGLLGYRVGDVVIGIVVKKRKTATIWTGILGQDNFTEFWKLYETKKSKNAKDPYFEKYFSENKGFSNTNKNGFFDETQEHFFATKIKDGMIFLNYENQKNDRNVFFKPNGCINDDSCKKVIASFYEIDDKNKTFEQQKNESLEGKIKPQIILFTGNKSNHTYYLLREDDKTEFEKWKQGQLKIIDSKKSDSSLKDFSRNLRLPTFLHPETKQIATYESFDFENYKIDDILENFGTKEKSLFDVENKNNSTQEKNNSTEKINFVKNKERLSKSIKNLSKKEYLELVESALEFIPERQAGQGLKGKTKDRYENTVMHYDELFSVMIGLYTDFDDDELVVNLMHKHFGNDEDWRTKLESIYNRTPKERPTIGTVFHIAKAYGFEFPKGKEKQEFTTKQLMEFCEDIPLRYNLRSMLIEYDGEPLKHKLPYMVFSQDYEIEVGKEKSKDVFNYQARKNEYDPIFIELEAIKKKANRIDINNLATRYLGTNDPLYDLMFKRFLIGMVARIYSPGCKHDSCLILKGKQNVGKSTMFSVLAKGDSNRYPDPFLDEFNFNGDKDEIMKMNQSWVIELAEIERFTAKKSSGQMKGFISKTTDKIRLPYGSEIEDYPRRCVFTGTVNEDEFLNDPTGLRRYWVIPVATDEIDNKLLKKERDGILASAIDSYMNGEQWHLTEDEYKASEQNNRDFEMKDAWFELIADYAEGKEQLGTTAQIMTEALNISKAEQNNQQKGRVSKIMKQLGYIEKQRTVVGKRKRVWELNSSVQSVQATQKTTQSEIDPCTKDAQTVCAVCESDDAQIDDDSYLHTDTKENNPSVQGLCKDQTPTQSEIDLPAQTAQTKIDSESENKVPDDDHQNDDGTTEDDFGLDIP